MIIGYSTRSAATLHLRTQRGRIFFHGEKITSIAYKAGDAAGGIILLSAHAWVQNDAQMKKQNKKSSALNVVPKIGCLVAMEKANEEGFRLFSGTDATVPKQQTSIMTTLGWILKR